MIEQASRRASEEALEPEPQVVLAVAVPASAVEAAGGGLPRGQAATVVRATVMGGGLTVMGGARSVVVGEAPPVASAAIIWARSLLRKSAIFVVSLVIE